MGIKTKHTEENALYFCTFTCFNWINLIDITHAYEEVYRFFDILTGKGYKLYGYVIMPNHIHLIVKNTDGKLTRHISNGKRFLAYFIVKQLTELKRNDLLLQMQSGVTASDKAAGKKHQVFIDSFDARLLFDDKMIYQKLQYIHQNPVAKKWNLAPDYLSYVHSSARYYELGEKGKVQLTNYLGE